MVFLCITMHFTKNPNMTTYDKLRCHTYCYYGSECHQTKTALVYEYNCFVVKCNLHLAVAYFYPQINQASGCCQCLETHYGSIHILSFYYGSIHLLSLLENDDWIVLASDESNASFIVSTGR